ncbi:histidine kinase [Eubacterium sp. 1001713B170207_170306_E7]|uniref:sensor histidine kinase n=1 Tax=Eubacterium sp. 1001713B170207_170306_E7 TaxID=2787097 RepID=UPI0018983D88|nr:histidine kinase [Eubacterium sp. 1001713B170207_170306_E7]
MATNIPLEGFSIIISVLLIICIIASKEHTKLNRLFLYMLAVNAFILGCDIFIWIGGGHLPLVGAMKAANFFVFSLGYLLVALFTAYMVTYIHEKGSAISCKIVPVIAVFCAVAILLVVISMFNNMLFYFSETGYFMRSPLHWITQIYPIIIILLDMAIILKHSRKLGIKDTFALLSYGILPALAIAAQIFRNGLALAYPATTISLLIIYVNIQVEQSKRLREKELELTQNRITMMLSQIQPHFLYNSLTAIAQLCREAPDRAGEATIAFANYLRGNLDSLTQENLVFFEKELHHIKTYLSLEKMRFEEKIQVIYSINATDFMLPSLTVQPLVENAVKHGICQKERGGTIWIETIETPESYIIKVSDDGVGFDPVTLAMDERQHIGIENVRFRLAYQCAGTLSIESHPGMGTTAEVTIPKNK